MVTEIELFGATVCDVTLGAFSKGTGVPTGGAGSVSGAYSTSPTFGVTSSVGET